MDRRYSGATIAVSAAGNVNHEEFVAKVSEHFSDLPAGEKKAKRRSPPNLSGTNLIGKEVEQVHFALVAMAPATTTIGST
ncbi:MAG: insulinase family protein [Fimbriimonadaceae bacterium]